MTLGSVLLSLALLILVGLYIARPIIKRDVRRERLPGKTDNLNVQKEALLIQIRTLDFDYETGKLSEEDYQESRTVLIDEAAAILKEIDTLEAADPGLEAEPPSTPSGKDADINADIEAAIANLRPSQVKPLPVKPSPIPSPPAATPGENGKQKFCPQCGQPTDADDKFCANCGQKLKKDPQHV